MDPPTYEDTIRNDNKNEDSNTNTNGYTNTNPQNSNPNTYEPSGNYNDEKKQPYQDHGNSNGYGQQQFNQPPPNTYYVPPQLVNISTSQHVNPSYPQFQANEAQRRQQGNFPRPNQPLTEGKSNGNHSTGFPGRSGASYNNAANR